MQFSATYKHADISPQKVRDIAELIRGKHTNDALQILRNTNKRAAYILDKVLRSAMANADQGLEANMEALRVKEAAVDAGKTRNKWRPRAKGRVGPIKTRSSHIRIVLDDGQ